MTYLPRWGNNFSRINFNQFHSTDATRPMDISPHSARTRKKHNMQQTGIYKVSSTSRSNHIEARACGQMNEWIGVQSGTRFIVAAAGKSDQQ
jgi:hypothetical protein